MTDRGSEASNRQTGRRSRAEARSEILDAAERFLWERPVRELTVGALMEHTTIGRSAFYVYFRDRYHLIAGLLERLEAELLDAARPWLGGSRHADPLGDVRSALDGTVAVWVAHGPVLRAIAEAAGQDTELEAAYRWGLLERFIDLVSQRIEEGQTLGRIRPLDARATATALIFMNERYLVDQMGRAPQADPDKVAETLSRIWSAALYGSHREGSKPRPRGRAEPTLRKPLADGNS